MTDPEMNDQENFSADWFDDPDLWEQCCDKLAAKDAARDADFESFFSQYDNDPNPYEGNYSED